MAKISKEELQRLGGAEWMLRQIKEKGIEEAEELIKKCNWEWVLNNIVGVRNEDFETSIKAIYNTFIG